jgi:hypothetical protein
MNAQFHNDSRPVQRTTSRLEMAAILLFGPVLVAVSAGLIYMMALNRGAGVAVIFGAGVWIVVFPWFALVAWSRFVSQSDWASQHMPLVRRVDHYASVYGLLALGYLTACADHRQFGFFAAVAVAIVYVMAFAKMGVHEATKTVPRPTHDSSPHETEEKRRRYSPP